MHKIFFFFFFSVAAFSHVLTSPTASKRSSHHSFTTSPRRLLPTQAAAAAAAPSCPIDFDYITQFPWAPTTCENELGSTLTECCTALRNTFGMGLAQYLKQTGYFELPDNATVYSCLDAFQLSLQANGLTQNLIGDCNGTLTPSMFIRSPLLCSGIESTSDWQQKMGTTGMDSSCKGDLTQSSVCQACTQDVTAANAKLRTFSNQTSSCVYFAILYAAAIANSDGPTNPSTAYCLLGIQPSPSSPKKLATAVYVSIGAGIVIIGGTAAALFLWLWVLRRRQLVHERFVNRSKKMLKTSLQPNTGAMWYKFEEVKAATSNFSELNLIGVGGFANVYKALMPDGSELAVKRIKNCTPEGDAEFMNEAEVINSVRHRNLVVLRGCCVASNTSDGHLRMLIYDFMANGSLEDYLFSGRKPVLGWPERRKIAVGAAKGLAYLHTGVQPAIIHRDIKANNILLDEDLNAKVADFGLARITEEGMTHLTTRVAGTQGYLAPEYALYGQLTEKSDVYSFGVLLLVLMSGRQALDTTLETASHFLITDWAWMMVKEGNVKGIIDERIRNQGPEDLMQRFVLVGILCAHLLVAFRPTLAQALKMLQGDAEIPEIPDRPLPLNYLAFEWQVAS